MDNDTITVEVAYALPDRQKIIELTVEKGITAYEAVRLSGIDSSFPEIDLNNAEMGVFSRLLDGRIRPGPKEYILDDRDRVEIYRPLQLDPKQARLKRAHQKNSGSKEKQSK